MKLATNAAGQVVQSRFPPRQLFNLTTSPVPAQLTATVDSSQSPQDQFRSQWTWPVTVPLERDTRWRWWGGSAFLPNGTDYYTAGQMISVGLRILQTGTWLCQWEFYYSAGVDKWNMYHRSEIEQVTATLSPVGLYSSDNSSCQIA